MKDINIVIDSQTHKVQFPDNFLGLNAENLQGNINFTFTNGFVNGIARLELSIDCESGFIPNLQNTGDSYTLPILSSLLTSDNIVMQLVIEQTDLITYKLTTDTSINHQKTYYTRSGVEGEYVYTIVENPKVADIGTYYEAQIPIFKTHIFNMTVGESINAVNTIPDDYPTWIDTLNSLVGQVNAKIIEMNQALAEVDNLDITATKEGTTVTITITRKDGSQQVVTITDGKDGVGIVKIEKTGTNLLVDTYTIYYTDDSTSTFQVKNGRGIVSIDKTDTNILTDTYTITYNDNTTSTFYVVNGNGVESIVKTGTSGLIDTYRISYTNGEYYDYQVANGNGIDNIQKTSTSGLVDTYTITYTNGTTSTYIITNGNGISNIAKTSTVDNVDTYTIYYTNGTTSTFTVTNSTVTNQEFQELQRLVDYNALYANALIKMNNSGTDLTINDTVNAPMPMTLSPSVLSQYTTTGKNLCHIDDFSTTYRGLTISATNNIITFNGTTTNIISAGENLWKNIKFTITEAGYYKVSTTKTVPSINFGYYKENSSVLINSSSELTEIGNYTSGIYIPANTTFNNLSFEIQIEKGQTATDFEEYTGGNPAPNPEFPETIHTISGDNEIRVFDKNIFNYDDFVNAAGSSYVTGTYNEFTYKKPEVATKYYLNCKENTRYTFSGYISSTLCNGIIRIYYTDGTYTVIKEQWSGSLSKTSFNIVSTSGKTVEHIRLITYGNYANWTIYDFQIEEGTIKSDYAYEKQYLPLNLGDLEYCKIGDYEDEFVIPDNQLFDKDNITSITGGSLTNDVIISNAISTNYGSVAANISNMILEKGTYYISMKIKKASGTTSAKINAIQIFASPSVSFSLTINPNLSTDYQLYEASIEVNETTSISKILIQLGTGNTNGVLNITDIMISKLSNIPYEPYNPNGKWYLKKNTNKKIFNGSEEIIKNTNYSTETMLVAQNLLSNAKSSQVVISDYFKNNFPTIINSVRLAAQYLLFGLDINDFATVEDFKNWLSNHNTKVYYPLFTPEYISLNDTLQSQLTEIYNWLVSYQDQTNISQVNNDLPFIINTITCYDLNKLLTRVEVLESEV